MKSYPIMRAYIKYTLFPIPNYFLVFDYSSSLAFLATRKRISWDAERSKSHHHVHNTYPRLSYRCLLVKEKKKKKKEEGVVERHSSSVDGAKVEEGKLGTVGWSKVRDNIGRRLKAELELPSMPERIPTNRRGMTARPQCLISANSISSRVYCHLIPRASRCPLCARVCVAHPFVNDGPKTPRIVSRILVENPSNSNFYFASSRGKFFEERLELSWREAKRRDSFDFLKRSLKGDSEISSPHASPSYASFLRFLYVWVCSNQKGGIIRVQTWNRTGSSVY